MTTDTLDPAQTDATSDAAAPAPRVEVALAYQGESHVDTDEQTSAIALFANARRAAVALRAELREPILVREALATLYDIVGADFRYKPKDRSAYLAYQRMKKASASLSAWKAQQQYHEWLQHNDPDAWSALDPVVTVHPDELALEVFSKDEGIWARLAFDIAGAKGALGVDEKSLRCGTTNVDFGESFFEGLQRVRSYRACSLALATDMPEHRHAGEGDTDGESGIEKALRLPDSWVRGFLQVQSAATLPRATFSLDPINLYNLLRWLRMHADVKRQRRALRLELVPGEAPRVILEPWEDEVFACSGAVYTGREPEVVRIWGRRRLMLATRLLPDLERVDVHVLGSGLPSFWVFHARSGVTLTLGLSGFTASNWGRALSFDLLMPRSSLITPELQQVVDILAARTSGSLAELAKEAGLSKADTLSVLQQASQQGKVAYDLAGDVYRIRPLTDAPLDLVRLAFRNDRERLAHDLLAEAGAIKILSENRIHGVGVEITGVVAVKADDREYRVTMRLGDDGRVLSAEDTSDFFRKHGLKEGPSAALIALRLAWAREESTRASERGSRKRRIRTETRTYVRRKNEDAAEETYQVSLDRKKLVLRWGRRGQPMRLQRLLFNDADAARDAYFDKVAALEATGFVDATAAAL